LRAILSIVVALATALVAMEAWTESTGKPAAALRIVYDESGEKVVTLRLSEGIEVTENLQDAVANILGTKYSEITDWLDSDGTTRVLRGTVRLPKKSRMSFEDNLDLSSFRVPLELGGLESLLLNVRLPDSPLSSVGILEGDYLLGTGWYRTTRALGELDEVWRVEYGWTAHHVTLRIVNALLPLVVLVGFFSYLRRRTTQGGTQDRSAAFLCARLHHLGSYAIMVGWPVYIGFLAPLTFIAYGHPRQYEFVVPITIAVVGCIATALAMHLRSSLFEISQRLSDSSWTRAAMTLQGLAHSSALLGSVLFSAAPWIESLESTSRNAAIALAIIFLVAIALGLWGRWYTGKSSGIVFRSLESGPTYAHFESLSRDIGLKRTPLLRLVSYSGGRLASAFELFGPADGSRPLFYPAITIDADLAKTSESNDLDATITHLLIRMKRAYDSRLKAVAMGYCMLAIPTIVAILYCVDRDILPVETSLGKLTTVALYSVTAFSALAIVGWLHYAWAARRYTEKADAAVFAHQNQPESQIRAILRDAESRGAHLESHFFSWMTLHAAPTERARRIAALGGLSADRSEMLIKQSIEETSSIVHCDIPDEPETYLERLIRHRTVVAILSLVLVVASPLIIATKIYETLLYDIMTIAPFLAVASTICAVINAVCFNRISCYGNRRLARSIEADREAENDTLILAIPVAFCPRGLDSLAETGNLRGAGLLRATSGRLHYDSGVETFSLEPGQITAVSIVTGVSPILPVCMIQIEWENGLSGAQNEFLIYPIFENTLMQSNKATLALASWIQDWCHMNTSERNHGSSASGAQIHSPTSKVTIRRNGYKLRLLILLRGVFSVIFIAGFMLFITVDAGQILDLGARNSALTMPLLFLGAMFMNFLLYHVYMLRLRSYLK